MRSFFVQQDHMQVFKFVLSCLDVFQLGTDGFAIQSGNQPNQNAVTYSFLYLPLGNLFPLQTTCTNSNTNNGLAKTKAL